MTIRIGIDAWPLSARPTGIGRYVRELCLELGRQLPDAEFVLYSPRAIDFPALPRWRQRIDAHARALPGYAWLKWRLPRLCAADDLDVFWATRTLTPRLPQRTASVSTVYDLNYRLVPETMPVVNRWAHRLWFRRDVLRARAVVAISQGTSDRLVAHLSRAADAIVLPAVSDRFHPRPRSEVAACLARHGIDGPYILGVGTQEPRKNLHALVDAYAALRGRGAVAQRLVLAGGKGWHNRALRAALDRHAGLPIHSVGYVAEDELPLLYAGADVFVFPSLYEGFGIPLLEARACGARIVASDIPELREAGGEQALYVAPTPRGLATGIEQALRRDRIAPVAATLPSWRKSAQTLSGVLRNLARGG